MLNDIDREARDEKLLTLLDRTLNSQKMDLSLYEQYGVKQTDGAS